MAEPYLAEELLPPSYEFGDELWVKVRVSRIYQNIPPGNNTYLVFPMRSDDRIANSLWIGDGNITCRSPSPTDRMGEELVEVVARAIQEARGLGPDTLHQHHEWGDYPTDAEHKYTGFDGTEHVLLMHRAWRARVPEARAVLTALRDKGVGLHE